MLKHKVKNNYIISQNNASDLSMPMLSDLEEVNKSISIVNKSFLTLGKPLRLENTLV